MAICSFLGNSAVLGDTLYPRLCNTLETIIRADNHVELLLTPGYGSFFSSCLKVALEMKSRYPDRVIITHVVKRDDYRTANDRLSKLPGCMVDRIRIAGVPTMKGKQAFLTEEYNLQQCVIRLSTHVICCLYEKLLERENSLLSYAKKWPNMEILDVSDREVSETIARRAPTMIKEREQFVLDKLDAGFVYREIGEMMGVSSGRARQLQVKAGSRLRRFSYEFFGRDYMPGKQSQWPVCVLFSLSDPSPPKMKMLTEVIDLLIEKYRIGLWKISVDCCASPFIKALVNWRWQFSHNPGEALRDYRPHLRAMVTDEWFAENAMNKNDILSEFHLFSSQIENVDTTLTSSGTAEYKMMAAMAEQADFFICDLSSSPLAEEIKKYFMHTKGVSLLDIGRNTHNEKASEKEPAELTSN